MIESRRSPSRRPRPHRVPSPDRWGRRVRRPLAGVVLLLTLGLASAQGWPLLDDARWRAMTPDEVRTYLASNDVEARSTSSLFPGYTPVIAATWRGASAEVVEVLLDAGADPNAVTDDGYTALHFAGRSARERVGRLLLARGADPFVRGRSDVTPLMTAMWGPEWSAGFAQALLDAGVPIDATNEFGQTALFDAAEWTNDPAALQWLIQRGANPNHRDQFGRTALHAAAEQATDPRVVHALVDLGLDPNASDASGWRPLHAAVRNETVAITEALLARGADPNAGDPGDRTPTLRAAYFAIAPGVLEALLDAGGRVDRVDDEGRNAADLLTQNTSMPAGARARFAERIDRALAAAPPPAAPPPATPDAGEGAGGGDPTPEPDTTDPPFDGGDEGRLGARDDGGTAASDDADDPASEDGPPFGGDGDAGRLGPIDGDAPDGGAPDDGSGPRIVLDGTDIVQGGSLTVTFAGGPGNPRDWVGVYAAGAETGTNYLGWAYVSGTQTAGASLREGRITFPRVNLPPGTYDVWFFVDDGYETIAGPERFTVRAP